MPRNANKARCQVPGCRNWAMRGHTHCRSHRDAELGPRGGGASTGNLNALKTGQYAHPFDRTSLQHLAQQLGSDPQQLPAHLGSAIASVHARTGDPLKTLIALQAVLAQLLPLLAQDLFLARLKDLLCQIPYRHRSAFQTILRNYALTMSPQDTIRLLRVAAAHFKEHSGIDDPSLSVIDRDDEPPPFSSLLETPTTQSSDPQEA